jgi:hypothetical protein
LAQVENQAQHFEVAEVWMGAPVVVKAGGHFVSQSAPAILGAPRLGCNGTHAGDEGGLAGLC